MSINPERRLEAKLPRVTDLVNRSAKRQEGGIGFGQ